mmetsp:Transcript_50332/g.133099  ORF Transcript_50332/g.133099 Transcript_50332/m.133099 type:complete len:298 (+) Transcript_50332:2-895(+)
MAFREHLLAPPVGTLSVRTSITRRPSQSPLGASVSFSPTSAAPLSPTSAQQQLEVTQEFAKGSLTLEGSEAANSTMRSTSPLRTTQFMASTESWMSQDSRANSTRLTGHGGLEGRTRQDFPGKPDSSIGLKSGQQKMWSFERLPSLLPTRLDRDFQTSGSPFGRGVAGPTNDASVCQGHLADPDALLASFPRGTVLPWMVMPHTWTSLQGGIRPRTGAAQSPKSTLQRSMSDTQLSSGRLMSTPASPGQPGYGRMGPPGTTESAGLDLHGVINTTWDNAGVAAGNCYPGSEGRWVGF